MKRFLKWFFFGPLLRLTLVALVLAAMLVGAAPLEWLDQVLFDQLVRLRPVTDIAPVAVVAIDRQSIDRIGNWPWPRTYLAEAVGQVAHQQPNAIGFHLLFPREEWNPGLAGIRSVRRKQNLEGSKSRVGNALAEIAADIDGDSRLQAVFRTAGSVVAPYRFLEGPVETQSSHDNLPPYLKWQNPEKNWQASLATLHNPLRHIFCQNQTIGVVTTYPELAAAAALQGHISYRDDVGGRIRSVPLLKAFDGKLFPALVLQLAGVTREKKNPFLKLDGYSLLLNGRPIATGADFGLLVNPETAAAVPRYSFNDVVNGNVPNDAFSGKTVLIGLTTAPLTPGGQLHVVEPPPVVAAAAAVADLVAGMQIIHPAWAFLLEAAALVYLGIFLVLVLPRLSLNLGVLMQTIFLGSWFAVVIALLVLKGMWFSLAPHLVVVVAGLLMIALQRFLAGGGQKFEDLKMLGLSFQSQGMLDMAFDKFRQCPVSDKSIKEILYNLGLDFERKRMFNKAIAVYGHLLKGGKFKDARKKIAELKEMEKSVVLGGSGGKDGTIIVGKGATAPTLGRYEVVRELGQGAMGTVYLGRDPKINREVAIKTLNLHVIEPDQIREVKERFFREAEAAGRLNHPNIVTIYDAGEEHDLAYMAMEYLEGKDLSHNCNGKKLLPVAEVMRIAAEVAEALAYAHKNDVVHRDIKPSNLMLLKTGQIKVTDFGIARVMNASQTQTGMVLGTPSYMSPEQVSGDRVKGATDLFSLGVVCYELLSGEKPFTGDSLGALTHNIANVKYTPLKRIRPDLPECCYAVVRKLLKKEIRDRYRNATEAADAIRKCIDKIG